MSDPGVVIVLDGPTLVGRSTTAAGLQQRWPEVRDGPLLGVGLDAALDALGAGSRRWRPLVLPHRAASSVSGTPVWGPLGREVITGMHRAAAAWATAGFDVVVDHTFLDRASATDLTATLRGVPTLFVGLVCHPDVLEERERVAGAPMGLATAELAAGRDAVTRDLILDTSESTTDELVDALLAAVRSWLRG